MANLSDRIAGQLNGEFVNGVKTDDINEFITANGVT